MTILLLCQLAGEIVSRGLALPVPGPVLGLVLLVGGLLAWGRKRGDAAVADTAVARVSDGLLGHLALLFVPAGVGVIQYGGLLRAEALPIACALVGSTAVTLVVTVLVFVGTSRLLGRSAADESEGVTPFGLWVYLSTTPLLWLAVTLVAWLAAEGLARLSGRNPLVNPVLIAGAIVATLLLASGTSYRSYFDGAQFVHFLLGPATVALGVPLYRNRVLVARNLVPMTAALIAGAFAAIVSAVGIAAALGAPRDVLASLAPKSVTTPVAMAVSERLGGQPSLTAALVILTGILGAVMVTPLMNALGIRDYAARGFAAGLAAHGIGTARAFTVDTLAGTFAGIALGLNALATAVLAPLVLALF